MLMKLFKRLRASQKDALPDANARIAELERELAEIKNLLKEQNQTTNKESPKSTQSPAVEQNVEMKAESPVATDENNGQSQHQDEVNNVALSNSSFFNKVLQGTYRGKANYVQENGSPINGEIVLKIDQCCFYVPPDRYNPYISVKIKHDAIKPIRFENGCLTIASQEGMKAFAVHGKDCERIQAWLRERLSELERVRNFPAVCLGFSDQCDEFPHLFLTKHTQDSTEARKYFRQKFPVFGKELPWYDGTVNFFIDGKQTQMYIEPYLSGEAWSWSEMENQIKISLRILEVGFFDDSESEFCFEYTITYLGDTLTEDKYVLVNNSKLHQPLPLSKWSKPDEETYIADSPVGLSGFYQVAWKTTSR